VEIDIDCVLQSIHKMLIHIHMEISSIIWYQSKSSVAERSGVTLAICYGLSGLSTYGLNGYNAPCWPILFFWNNS